VLSGHLHSHTLPAAIFAACRYAATKAWLKDRLDAPAPRAFLRGYNVSKDFDQHLRKFGKTAKKYAHLC
jgi:hypothetical protein